MHFPVELALGFARLPVHLLCEVLAYTLGFQFYPYLRTNHADRISNANQQ